MRLAILLLLLLCCATALGQTNEPISSDSTPKAQDYVLVFGSPGKNSGGVDILTDTQGVDFRPYLKEALAEIKKNWYHLIPESAERKKGKLAIEFALTKDGNLADMKLVATSGERTLDRPAWGSIVACNPFKPLPDKFTRPIFGVAGALLLLPGPKREEVRFQLAWPRPTMSIWPAPMMSRRRATYR